MNQTKELVEFEKWQNEWHEYKIEMVAHDNLLRYDISNFKKIHTDLSLSELTLAFCNKWIGHRTVFGVEYIQYLMTIIKGQTD